MAFLPYFFIKKMFRSALLSLNMTMKYVKSMGDISLSCHFERRQSQSEKSKNAQFDYNHTRKALLSCHSGLA